MTDLQDAGEARTRHLTPKATGIAAMCALTLALVGCSPAPAGREAGAPSQAKVDKSTQQNVALDAYVEAERGAIPAIQEANPGVYSQVTISGIYPDTVEYAYVYAQQVDAAGTTGYFDDMTPALQTLCDTQVFPAMESAGVTTSQKVIYTYYNADGSQLWSQTFAPS